MSPLLSFAKNNIFYTLSNKVKKIQEDSLDLIPSSLKILIIGGNVGLKAKLCLPKCFAKKNKK